MQFEREVLVMSSLPPHPNVIGLVGISPMPPSVALVTKYCAR